MSIFCVSPQIPSTRDLIFSDLFILVLKINLMDFMMMDDFFCKIFFFTNFTDPIQYFELTVNSCLCRGSFFKT